ncbi:hypothetical protein P154DRAFT_521986 [Amniculicola lignicola CBS 123094]|uniref:HTH psq-type domain-containing protein n=1 Tax=Amniculicola lignicola CBS 123094 TaxID=1392246 RepID=A0A6A5WPH8_9PLEO|nr:hypothetical protein P154DRAFT_521986 [Amniculicola lignicola CBS 123094]
MDPIQDAVTFFESQEPGEELSYTEVAKRYNINRVTLARRHQGVQTTRAAAKTTGIDCKRHHANSEAKYNLYFDLLY